MQQAHFQSPGATFMRVMGGFGGFVKRMLLPSFDGPGTQVCVCVGRSVLGVCVCACLFTPVLVCG
jgi:hypothetical protein